MEDLNEMLLKTLYEKYNTLLLSKKQTSEVLGISQPTLERWGNKDYGPKYLREGKDNRKYPIHNVVEFLVNE